MVIRQSLISPLIIIILVIALLMSIALFFMSLAEKSRIESDIDSKCDVIDRFVKKSKMPMTEGSIIFLTEEENKLKNIYNRFKLTLESPLNEEVPKEELEPLKFKERLIQTQKRLREDAKRHNLALPESLGLTKYEAELSQPSEIPDLIKRLKVLEELIRMMALSGISSLDEINFSSSGTKRDFYYDVPSSFKLDCTTSGLIDFLCKLRSSPFIFVIDDLDIKKIQKIQTSRDKEEVGKEGLKVSLSVRAIALK